MLNVFLSAASALNTGDGRGVGRNYIFGSWLRALLCCANSLVYQSATSLLPHAAIYNIRTSRIYKSIFQVSQRHVLPFFSAIFLVWLTATAGSHFVFNIADSMGAYCYETDKAKLERLEKKGQRSAGEIIFPTSDLCFATGVYVTKGAKYAFSIIQDSPWIDLSLPYETHPDGYRIATLPTFVTKLVKAAALPLRRVIFRRWFTVIARIGPLGVYEDFLDPELERIYTYSGTQTVKRSGEVFLYVNQATIGLPWITNFFYSKNSGKAHIRIVRQ